jgi:NAD(P)-dependent dehydrogenase (short-subunit alcohol dehydrogenase family)
LRDLLLKASSPRVITTSSVAAKFGKIDKRIVEGSIKYNPTKAYSFSKLALQIWAYLMSNYKEIDFICTHPGVSRTELFTRFDKPKFPFNIAYKLFSQSSVEGSKTLVEAVVLDEVKKPLYIGPRGFMGLKGKPKRVKYLKKAKNAKNKAELEKITKERLEGRK